MPYLVIDGSFSQKNGDSVLWISKMKDELENAERKNIISKTKVKIIL